jgi:nicotinamidase/pyrazinamidase
MELQKETTALAIIDAQRCFFPEEEGQRLEEPGYGELPVPGSERIVGPINRLTEVAHSLGLIIVHTEDSHPRETAHFSNQPNFVNTWPEHAIAGTPGAALHSELLIAHQPGLSTRFIKGDKAAITPADDTSYTGALAHQPNNIEPLPDYLRIHGVKSVILCGQTIGDGKDNPLCVDSTALDLQKLGFETILATDTVEPVLPENKAKCFMNLGKAGVRLATTAEIVALMQEGAKDGNA